MTAIQSRVRDVAVIKGVLASAVLVIMLITFRRPIPLLVAAVDLALVGVYVMAGQRWPRWSTYLLIAETTLAFTPRQFVQGYVNGINWVFYIPLPLAAAYVMQRRAALIRATIIVTLIAIPIMLTAALTLEPHIERQEIFTLIAYIAVVLWGTIWLSGRTMRQED